MKAFPSPHDPKTGTMQHGMELRDYFAAKEMELGISVTKDFYGVDKEEVAKWCYGMADAMMEARKQ